MVVSLSGRSATFVFGEVEEATRGEKGNDNQDLTDVQVWFQRLYDSDLDVPALLGKKSKEPCTFRFPALWRVPPAFPRVPFQALHLKCLNDSLRAGHNSSFTDRLKTEMIHSD